MKKIVSLLVITTMLLSLALVPVASAEEYPCWLSLNLYFDDNYNEMLDVGEAGNGIKLDFIDNKGNKTASVTADEFGNCYAELKAGVYKILVTMPEGRELYGGKMSDIRSGNFLYSNHVSRGVFEIEYEAKASMQAMETITLEPLSDGYLGGFVWNDINQNRQMYVEGQEYIEFEKDESAIHQAIVSLWDESGKLIEQQETDEFGQFGFSVLPYEKITIKIELPSGYSAFRPVSEIDKVREVVTKSGDETMENFYFYEYDGITDSDPSAPPSDNGGNNTTTDQQNPVPENGSDNTKTDGTDNGLENGSDNTKTDGTDNGLENGSDNTKTDGTDNGLENGSDNTKTDGTDNGPEDGSDNTKTDGIDNAPEDGSDNTKTDGTDNAPEDGSDNTKTDGTDNAPEDGSDNTKTDGTDNGPENGVEGPKPTLNKKDHYSYVMGYPDGNIKPENNISREEVASILFRLLEDHVRDSYYSKNITFSDMKADMWSLTSVSTMAKAGVITGYTDGTFRPENDITRAEFATLCAKFDTGAAYSGADKFPDITGHWAAKYINLASERGWVSGYADGSFRPDDYITRAEAITLINNVLERIVADDGMLPDMVVWPDNTPDKWYYKPIQEATNSHYYEMNDGVETWTAMREPRDWTLLER